LTGADPDLPGAGPHAAAASCLLRPDDLGVDVDGAGQVEPDLCRGCRQDRQPGGQLVYGREREVGERSRLVSWTSAPEFGELPDKGSALVVTGSSGGRTRRQILGFPS
jgi:hypothetical protein